MAPLPESNIRTYLTTLLRRTSSPTPSATLSLSPKAALLIGRAQQLVAREANPADGVTPLENINNNAVFAVFGLIGVAFVCTGIWFFFWAKNGGFYFQENDWEDYKSTVLRRKGPNGTTLSGATESTDLGGGSVVHGEKRSVWGRKKKGAKRYKDFEDDESSQMTGSAGGSTLGSEMSELKSKKEKKKRRPKKEARLRGGDLADEEDVDPSVIDAMRAYRHEKPARVGGLNKQPDGSAWDGSTQDGGSTAASELLPNREKTPTSTPTKPKKERNDRYTGGNGGIRQVVSQSTPSTTNSNFWERSSRADPVEDPIKVEARKLQDKGRAAQRRDFSFRTGDDSTVVSEEASRSARREERERRRASRSPTKKLPGSYYEESEVGSAVSAVTGDTGTKTYHHPIPGLSGSGGGSEYAEERRKKRAHGGGGGGYRRGRRDSLDD